MGGNRQADTNKRAVFRYMTAVGRHRQGLDSGFIATEFSPLVIFY